MDTLSFYSTQSTITDPGKHSEMFNDLPNDIRGLCQVVQGLIIHYISGEKVFDHKIPKERLPEIDTCYIAGERNIAKVNSKRIDAKGKFR